MNRDTESFNTFMAAMKMPKVTEKRSVSAKSPGEVSKLATEVLLLTLEACRMTGWLIWQQKMETPIR